MPWVITAKANDYHFKTGQRKVPERGCCTLPWGIPTSLISCFRFYSCLHSSKECDQLMPASSPCWYSRSIFHFPARGCICLMAQETTDEIGRTTPVSSSLLQFVMRSRARAEFFAGLMVLAVIGYLAKRRAGLFWSSLVLTGGVLLASPTAYPWYFTWSIPFLCFCPSPAWLLMSVTSVLGYTPPLADGSGNSLLMLSLEYAPVYLWLAYYCWAVPKRRSADVQEIGISAHGVQPLHSRMSL